MERYEKNDCGQEISVLRTITVHISVQLKFLNSSFVSKLLLPKSWSCDKLNEVLATVKVFEFGNTYLPDPTNQRIKTPIWGK